MKISNIKEIFQSADEVLFNETDDDLFNVRLFNDNSAQVWYGNKDRKEKISDVKRIYAKDGIYLLLTIDGNLYGWGYNEFKSITSEDVKWLSFDKKVLIDTNVKQMSISSNDALSSAAGIFYLKNNGGLYFRGYLG